MTLHINYDHSCSNCKAYYIPYDDSISCPNCNMVEVERFDFIPEAVESMIFNKEIYKSYTPGAWLVGSLADHILMLLFGLFDSFESQNYEELTIDNYASMWLSRMVWGEQQYLKEHVHSIALRVAKELYKADS